MTSVQVPLSKKRLLRDEKDTSIAGFYHCSLMLHPWIRVEYIRLDPTVYKAYQFCYYEVGENARPYGLLLPLCFGYEKSLKHFHTICKRQTHG